MKRYNLFLKGFVALLALLLMIVFMGMPVYGSGGVKEGEPVPTFPLIDENDRVVDFGTLIDRPTILYFTHNACWYCEQIIRLLKRAESKYGKDSLRIIGINVMAKDSRLVKSYKEELGFTFLMFAGNKAELLETYRINYVPVLVFIDAKRIVRKVVGHYIHEPELHQIIDDIIRQ